MFKIFVGNLSYNTTADAVRQLFVRHADVDDVALPVDAETGKLRGFAIVMIKDEQKGLAAIAAMRGARLDGRSLVINPARKKGDPPPPKRERQSRGGVRDRQGGGGGGYGANRSGERGARSGGGGGYAGGRGTYGRPRTFGNRPTRPRPDSSNPQRGNRARPDESGRSSGGPAGGPKDDS